MRIVSSLALALTLLAGPARAESEPLNLHLEPGATMFLTAPGADYFNPGFAAALKLDYRLDALPWIAPQLTVHFAQLGARVPRFTEPGRALTAGVGVRSRFFDDDSGWLSDELTAAAGWLGNAWVDASLLAVGTGPYLRFGYEVGAGYEVSAIRPLQVGLFVRFLQILQPDGGSTSGTDALLLSAGLSFSFGFDSPLREATPAATGIAPAKRAVAPGSSTRAADQDSDGIADAEDRCPAEPETVNGQQDDDGCPDAGEELVVLTRDRIEIRGPMRFDQVLFETGTWQVRREAYPTLATVAKVLFLHPEIRRVRIEGHTDTSGGEAFNRELSQRRAEAIREHLVEVNGVEPDRLQAEGFGYDRPIAGNDTPEGRAQNRRVEFVIVERAETPGS